MDTSTYNLDQDLTNLSMSDMTKESPSGAPYLNVMSSGCFFFDVILTIAERRRLTTMCANPFRPGMSRSTYMWLSVTRRWLEKREESYHIISVNNILSWCCSVILYTEAVNLPLLNTLQLYTSCHWPTGNISRHIQGQCIYSFEDSICSALDIFCMFLASDFIAFSFCYQKQKIANWEILCWRVLFSGI
jgi:hypothetical protein